MMQVLLLSLNEPNALIRQTTLIFFREMIPYQEVKQVLRENITVIVREVASFPRKSPLDGRSR